MTIVCEPDPDVARNLATVVGGDVRTVDCLPDVADMLGDTTLVVIGPSVPLGKALQFSIRLRLAAIASGVVLVHESPDAELRSLAGAAGVREVVAAGDRVGLAAACRRVQDALPVPPVLETQRGQVLTVFAGKGGLGKTTLATNLAVALHSAGRRVCLVDLNLEFGDVATVLRLVPQRNLASADPHARSLDAAGVIDLVTPFQHGLDCILAPDAPGAAQRIPVTLIEELLTVLPTMYDDVVVDTPARFSTVALTALDLSHHHVLLATPQMPALIALHRTLDSLDLLCYQRRARSVVLNRCDPRAGLGNSEVEQIINAPISAYLPDTADVSASVNQGVPLASRNPEHLLSQAVRQFVETRVPLGNRTAQYGASRP
jgi:MinD-like ATPase involved in chromosome partitioning or flagellar assembly